MEEISKKDMRLNWHGHMMRREENCVGWIAMGMEVQGRRKRGRPRRRWLDREISMISEKRTVRGGSV